MRKQQLPRVRKFQVKRFLRMGLKALNFGNTLEAVIELIREIWDLFA